MRPEQDASPLRRRISELGEHDATRPLQRRIPELHLPLGVQVSGRHNSQNIHSRGPHIHSKDAYGSGEHDATRASPLRRRIS